MKWYDIDWEAWDKRDKKRSERGDAGIIMILGGITAAINSTLSLFIEKYIYVYIALIIIMMLLAIHNYVQIYIKYNDKYKRGHSYVKRKFGTIGFAIMSWYNINMLVADSMGGTISMIYLAVILLVLFPFMYYLVNKVWYNFDKKRYGEIDANNPKQKRYYNEPKISWNDEIDYSILREKRKGKAKRKKKSSGGSGTALK